MDTTSVGTANKQSPTSTNQQYDDDMHAWQSVCLCYVTWGSCLMSGTVVMAPAAPASCLGQ